MTTAEVLSLPHIKAGRTMNAAMAAGNYYLLISQNGHNLNFPQAQTSEEAIALFAINHPEETKPGMVFTMALVIGGMIGSRVLQLCPPYTVPEG